VHSFVIAQAGGMPERFLVKILKPLVDARILHSARGSHGGFRLVRRPEDISVLDVIETVGGPICGQVPATTENDSQAFDKRLDAVCQQVAKIVRGTLRKVSIKDLVKGR
jgi:Rrf2 family protein